MSLPFPAPLLVRLCQPAFTAPNRTLPESVYSQIRTNYIPSAVEMVQISQRLSEAQPDLTRYDEEISRLRPFVGPVEEELSAVTGQVEQERSALRKYIDGYRCLQARIRTLPPEILAEIFLCCMPDYTSRCDTISRPGGQMALRIGLVCTRWRSIVLSLEKVWSSIYLALRDTNGHTANILETYITRSGTHSLSIKVTDEGGRCAQFSAITILIRDSHRWRRVALDFEITTYTVLDYFLLPVKGNLPLLEELSIDPAAAQTNYFTTCPKLRTLTFYDLHCPEPDFPRSQITALSIHSGNSVDGLFCVSRHANLQQLTIGGYFMRSGRRGFITGYPVTLNLGALVLRVGRTRPTDDNGIPFFLENLTLPCLRSLEVQDCGDTAWFWESKSIISLLYRSSCALEVLTLKSATVGEGELVELLTIVPTLKALTIDTISKDESWAYESRNLFTASLLETLTSTRDNNSNSISHSPFLLPELTHIEMLVADPFLDERLIANMIESRRPHILSNSLSSSTPSIEYVSINFLDRTSELHPEFRTRMLELSLQGLKVTLHDGKTPSPRK